MSTTEEPSEAQAQQNATAQPLVMQLILDRSLVKNPEWGVGPLMAQAAHAAMAVAEQTRSHELTQEYVKPANLSHMHKVVLKGPEKLSLTQLSEKLTEARKEAQSNGDTSFPDHFLWIEQPENIPTVLAVAPNRKPDALKKILNKCSLLRA